MILILGKDGQVGRALVTLLGARALAFGSAEVNFLDAGFIQKIESQIGNKKISAVINAAAFTAVDKAEGEGKEKAFRINGAAVGELAAWCKKRDVLLVHYSTDYVFGDNGDKSHREGDKTAPLNAYGASKLEGEEAIAAAGGRYLIFRTSWVYDAQGSNFFNTILRLLAEKDSLNVIDDQYGAPTYAPHLARATLAVLALPEFPSGLYHLCSSGETSWYGFAHAIFALARGHVSGVKCTAIHPIPATAYPLPAKRPHNSRLDCSRARETFGIALPDWETGLKECFEEKYAGSGLRDSGAKNHPA